MMATIAAVLFGLALILELADTSFGIITASTLTTGGLLFVALHLGAFASIGRRGRSWR